MRLRRCVHHFGHPVQVEWGSGGGVECCPGSGQGDQLATISHYQLLHPSLHAQLCHRYATNTQNQVITGKTSLKIKTSFMAYFFQKFACNADFLAKSVLYYVLGELGKSIKLVDLKIKVGKVVKLLKPNAPRHPLKNIFAKLVRY